MDLKDIALFRAIVISGSLSGAGRQMRMTPMAVSRRLTVLETEVGARLIHRTTRSLSLTPEGEEFLPYAISLLETQDAALASIASGEGGLTGTLRISAPNLIGHSVVVPALVQLMADNPALQVDISLTDAVIDVTGAGMDLAIRVSPLVSSSMIATRLAVNPRVLCAAPSYLMTFGAPLTTSDLKSHACLVLQGLGDWRFIVEGEVRNFPVTGPMTANSVDALRKACVMGAGLALLTYWDVQSALRDGSLVQVALADADPDSLGIWAVLPTRQHVPARVRALIEALRTHFHDHMEAWSA